MRLRRSSPTALRHRSRRAAAARLRSAAERSPRTSRRQLGRGAAPKRRYRAGSTNRPANVGDQAAEDHHRHRVHDLEAGPRPRTTNGSASSASAAAVVRIGASRSRAPARTSAAPKASPSCRSSSWKWRISSTLVRSGEREQRQEPDQRAERELGAADQRARARRRPAPPAAVRKASAASRQLRNAAWSSRKTPSSGGEGEARASRSRRSPRRWSLEHLGVVLEREARRRRGDPRMSSATAPRLRPSTSASTSTRRETASRSIATGGRRDPHVGHLAEPHVAAAGRSISRLRTFADAARASRDRPARSRRRPSGPRRRCRPGCPAAAWPPRGARRRA